jgi:hypothetical protein
MAPGGACYNNRLKGLVVCAVVMGGGCGCGGGVSRYLDKNDKFASHVTLAG